MKRESFLLGSLHELIQNYVCFKPEWVSGRGFRFLAAAILSKHTFLLSRSPESRFIRFGCEQ